MVNGEYGRYVRDIVWRPLPAVHLGRMVRGTRTSRRFTVTTTKHRTQTHPHEDTLPMTWKDMVVIMNHGIVGVAVGMAV
jgi:hypothetical protein